jgi:hypothetical protein
VRFDFNDLGIGKTIDNLFGIAAPDNIFKNIALDVYFLEIKLQNFLLKSVVIFYFVTGI